MLISKLRTDGKGSSAISLSLSGLRKWYQGALWLGGVNAMLMGQGVHFLFLEVSKLPLHSQQIIYLCMTQVYSTDLPKGTDMILCCCLLKKHRVNPLMISVSNRHNCVKTERKKEKKTVKLLLVSVAAH